MDCKIDFHLDWINRMQINNTGNQAKERLPVYQILKWAEHLF